MKVLFGLLGLGLASSQVIVTEEDLQRFQTAVWLNEDEVAAAVGFPDETNDPYPSNDDGYNVEIDEQTNCHIVFQDPDKNTYTMETAVNTPESPFGAFLTHEGPCGVCSNLEDLSVYLLERDLTDPVRTCGFIPFPKLARQCLRNIGFSEKCMRIWFFNTGFTRRNCLGTCLLYVTSPNTEAEGTNNPCEPIEGEERLLTDELIDEEEQRKLIDFGTQRIFFKEKGCKMTINGGDACEDFQYENGEFRLNPCIQCDECKSGPLFKKIAGRTRRGSGISSNIPRPNLPVILHTYFTSGGDVTSLE